MTYCNSYRTREPEYLIENNASKETNTLALWNGVIVYSDKLVLTTSHPHIDLTGGQCHCTELVAQLPVNLVDLIDNRKSSLTLVMMTKLQRKPRSFPFETKLNRVITRKT
jgi:hypothetical protein